MNPDISITEMTEKTALAPEFSQEPLIKLKESVYASLETYSNIHRGSGHKSAVSTYLYEQARKIVLEQLGLKKSRYQVIFCNLRMAERLRAILNPTSLKIITSGDIGLSLGVWAVAVKKNALPKGDPFQSGGGTTRLVSTSWIVWAKTPDKFEAGTPSIINIIAFARALQLIRVYGTGTFNNNLKGTLTANEILYNDKLGQFSGNELLDEFRKSEIGRNISVPTVEGIKQFINLDNGASTPAFTPVWEAAWNSWQLSESLRKDIIKEAKSICSDFLGAPADSYDFIFTSNTTEAVNLAAESLGMEPDKEIEPVVINTILEHNSNDLPWRMIPGISHIRLETDAEGFLDLNKLDILLSEYNQKFIHGEKRIRILALSGASNVLGTFNDLSEISRIVHRYGVRLLVDGAQLIAHRKVDVEEYGIDYLAFSAHKAYAPFGSGLLVVRRGILNFDPSELQLIQSSGEENISGIAAMSKSLLILNRIGLDLIQKEEQALTSKALRGLSSIEGLKVYGITDPDSPKIRHRGGVIAFNFTKIFSHVVAKELADRGGIGVRFGCHCAHVLVKWLLNVPPWLEKFQKVMVTVFPAVQLPGVARISLGIENSESDVDSLIDELRKIKNENEKNQKPEPGNVVLISKKDFRKQMDKYIAAAASRVYS
jgi:selenocysteine lyase/cysteine desulfurase